MVSTLSELPSLDVNHPSWAEVIELDQAHMQHPWSLGQWAGAGSEYQWATTWTEGRSTKGFALFQLSPWEKVAHLLKIALRPEFRGKGEAQAFWNSLCEGLRGKEMERIYLEVAVDNLVAISFYRKMGFRPLRRVSAFYSDGKDAWTMERTL